MTDPEQAVQETIVAERAAILAHARSMCGGVDRWVARGVLTADDGALIKRAVNVFAGDVAIGLHIERDDHTILKAVKAVAEGA